MKGKWDIIANPVGGNYIYQVVRIRDTNQLMHSGNLECDRVYEDREEALKRAEELNREEGMIT